MPIRETFWNIPQWAEVGQYILGLLSILVFAYGVIRRTTTWAKGRPAVRIDHPLRRIGGVLTHALAQVRTLSQPYPGIMHFSIFWGMVFLFTGTVLATIDWDVTRLVLGFQFLEGVVYASYELVLDIFGILLLVGVALAAWRRYAMRPIRLRSSISPKQAPDDLYALVFLALIAVTGYLIEGLRIAVIKPWWAPWSPVGQWIANLLSSWGDPTNRTLHTSIWIFHAIIAFGFIATIPYTKFFHMFTSPLNIFFRKLEPVGELPPIKNIEEAEILGTGKIEDWTWKSLLDFESCTRCGRCQVACPAFATGKPLSPYNVIVKLGDHLWRSPLAVQARLDPDGNGHNGEAALPAMVGDVITREELWDCTTCAACVQACPVFIDQLGAIVEMRRYLAMSEGDIERTLNAAFTSMERNGNPYMLPQAQRADWAKGLGVRTMAEVDGKPPLLYWVGCAASYDDRNKQVARAFVKILQAAGIDFAILGTEEKCNGDPARRAGNEYLFQMMCQENVETLNGYGIKNIVTACPHCFNTLKNEYPQFGGDFHVMHHSQFIAGLLKEGKLKLAEPAQAALLAYHDPCYLGRHNEVFDEPRSAIAQATGSRPIELPRHGPNSFCCGAGGARNWMEESRGTRINQNRATEAINSGAKTLEVACPFCMGMLTDGLKAREADGMAHMDIQDIAELVAARLPQAPAEPTP